jgi:uncharacterized hydrophobic protein (TIGR00271 family)
MSDVSSAAAPRSFADARWARVPLYRWWRRCIVDTVDHQHVIERIVDESGLTARYIFMTMMSAGIAVLGLLLSSPAVVIGAMLISPLMGPILGLGFALALFDFVELRRAFTAFLAGSVAAVLFTALIVLASPLKGVTAEILARTRPNLFDLLVALFAALAGTFAIIRGRGETIVGVAIATALMPPLAVVGYGFATWNMPVLGGSLALFGTNFLTIALAATIVARLYGFGHSLSSKQSWMQTSVLLLAFVAMSVPLALSLSQIAREALIANQVRAFLATRFGPDARVNQLDIDFGRSPWLVRSVVILPRDKALGAGALRAELVRRIGRPLTVQVDQVLFDPAADSGAERAALERATAAAADGADKGESVAALVALASGTAPETVTIDREHQRVVAAGVPLPNATLATYRALETRVAAFADGWTVEITPPRAAMPEIAFADGADSLDDASREAVLTSAWAARRWNDRALAVPGLPEDAPPEAPSLVQRRALAVAAVLREQGIEAVAASTTAAPFRLSAPEPQQ